MKTEAIGLIAEIVELMSLHNLNEMERRLLESHARRLIEIVNEYDEIAEERES